MMTTTMMNMLKTRRLDKTDDTASVGIVQMEDTSCLTGEAATKQTGNGNTNRVYIVALKHECYERTNQGGTLEDFQRVKNLT